MRPALGLLLATLVPACSLPRPYGEGVNLHTFLSGGARALDHERFEGHAVYGLELASRDASGWGYEIGASYGIEDDGGPREHEAEFDEYALGLRRTWLPEDGATLSYVAFGGNYQRTEHMLHGPTAEFDDRGLAAYVHAGTLWRLTRVVLDQGTDVLAGFDLRASVGDDYDALALVFVLGFGR